MDMNQPKNGSSVADLIQSLLKTDPCFQQKLKQRLSDESHQVRNPFKIISSLFSKGILCDGSKTVGGIVGLKEMIVQAVITIACSNGDDAIAGLMATLEDSGNSHVIAAIGAWCEDNFALEVHSGRSKSGDDPVVRATASTTLPKQRKNEVERKGSVADEVSKEKPAVVGPPTIKKTAPSNGLQEVATFNCTKVDPLGLQLDKDKVTAHLSDGTVQLWNWHRRDDENKMINCGLKDVACVQCDQEILVIGTAGGTVYLFDVRTLEEKFSMRFGEPVDMIKFAASNLVILTHKDDAGNLWQVDISRPDMRLLNRKSLTKVNNNLGLFVDLDSVNICFSSSDGVVSILDARTGHRFPENSAHSRCFSAETSVLSLKVADVISKKRILVAGCENGDIFVWGSYNFSDEWVLDHQIQTLQGHKQPVHHLCIVNGHLISLDKNGKLLMWSGYDLDNEDFPQPVPRVLAENFQNVTSLVAYERWLASGCSDGTINIWTLPDLWLRTG